MERNINLKPNIITKTKSQFDFCDFLEEQSYLEHNHIEGNRLIAKLKSQYTFKSCKKEDFVYRLEYINTKITDETNFIEKCADHGWELIEIEPYRDLFFIKTKYTRYYFCKKKEPIEESNEISDIPSRLKLCAEISKILLFEFIFMLSFLLIVNIINLIYDFNLIIKSIYIIIICCSVFFTWRYLKMNLGIYPKIKHLLSIHTLFLHKNI